MIKSVLEAAGKKVGMIGTNGIYSWAVIRRPPTPPLRATSCKRPSASFWTQAAMWP